MTKYLSLFFIVLQSLLQAQEPTTSFTLTSGEKSKVIYGYEDISIYTLKKNNGRDSLYRRYSANFIKLEGDTMLVSAAGLSEDRLYDVRRDSGKFSILEFAHDSLIKIPVQEITNIYYSRNRLQGALTMTGAFSIASAFVVGPLISIDKGGFNSQRFESVAVASLGVLAAAIITGVSVGQKNYWLQPLKAGRRLWVMKG